MSTYERAFLLVVCGLLTAIPIKTNADIIYDVTFEDPPHVFGAYTATGAPPTYPSSGSALVTNMPGFSSQAGLVAGYLGFNAPVPFTSGVHSVSWDFMNLSENTLGIGPNAALFANSGLYLAHGVLGGVSLFESGSVVVYDGPYSVSNFASYTFTIDLDARVYSFAINGTNVLTDRALPDATTSLDSFNFQRPGNNEFAIDNFRWEVIPEPSTSLLILSGLAVISSRFVSIRGQRR